MKKLNFNLIVKCLFSQLHVILNCLNELFMSVFFFRAKLEHVDPMEDLDPLDLL